jgi:hypothetical protein
MYTSLAKYKNKTVLKYDKLKSFSGPRIDWCLCFRVFQRLRNKGLSVTRDALMPKAKECARNSTVPFKASRGWCEKFMKRESLSLRWRTNISQKLPSEFETKLIEFQRFIIGLRRRYKYSLSRIDNADETAVYIDMPRNYAVNFKRGKQVAMKITGYENLMCYCHVVYDSKWQ